MKIFLEGGNVLTNKLSKDFFIWLDTFYNVFPMTYDYTFRAVFQKHPLILKKFVGDILNLDFINRCNIYFEDDYLKKDDKEDGDFVFIYIVIDDQINLVIKVEREVFESDYFQNNLHESDWFSDLKRKGDKLDDENSSKIDKPLEKSDLDDDSISVMYMIDSKRNIVVGVYQISIFVYTSYYRKLYYEKGYRNIKTVWLTSLSPKSYTELYELMNQVLDSRLLYMFMSYVMEMSDDDYIEYMLQKESYRENRLNKKYETLKSDAIKKMQLEIAKKLQTEGMNLETISKIVGLTIEEIKAILNDTDD